MDIDGISIKMLEETVEKDNTVYVWLLDDGTLKKTPLSKILELVHTLYSEREAYRKGLRRLKKRNEKLVHQNVEEIVRKFCETTMYKENQALVSERDSLKKEIEEYEATFDIFNQRKYRKMFVEEWKEEYQKELDKQGEGVIAGFPDADYVYKRYFEQKEKIEQLTNKNNELLKAYGAVSGLNTHINNKRAELQKQVDELKDERENMQAEIMETEELRLQAVKDTAKEILQELFETKLKMGNDYVIYADNIKVFAKRYGVEVE